MVLLLRMFVVLGPICVALCRRFTPCIGNNSDFHEAWSLHGEPFGATEFE